MSRGRNLSSNRDDLRYCDSERAVSDLEVWTGVTGQTAFTHMGRAHGRSRVQSWIRDRVTELRSCNGAGWCANPPKAGRFLRRREAGGVKESMRGGGWLDLGAAAAVGCGLGRAGSRYQRQFAALPLSARRGVHFACEDEPSPNWRLALVVLCKPLRQSVTTCRRQPSGGTGSMDCQLFPPSAFRSAPSGSACPWAALQTTFAQSDVCSPPITPWIAVCRAIDSELWKSDSRVARAVSHGRVPAYSAKAASSSTIASSRVLPTS